MKAVKLGKHNEDIEAVQQSKIVRKIKANRALNAKRSKFFGVKNNCGTASLSQQTKRKIYIRGNPKYVYPSVILSFIIVRGASAPQSGATKPFFKKIGGENKKK